MRRKNVDTPCYTLHVKWRIEDMLGYENLPGVTGSARLLTYPRLHKISMEHWSLWCRGLSYTVKHEVHKP